MATAPSRIPARGGGARSRYSFRNRMTRAARVSVCLLLVCCAACSDAGPSREFPAASTAQVEHIEVFLEEGYSLADGYTVPSGRLFETQAADSGHFVAAEVEGSGGFVGVWWHGGTPESPTMTMAVDQIADEACVCQWARNTAAGDLFNDLAQELKRFVESKRDAR